MIISEYSKFLQRHNNQLLKRETTALELLYKWLKEVINKNPKNNIEKIVHKEILFAQNDCGDYIIIGKSDSGRILVNALINFAKSYDNYTYSKWLEMTESNYHKSP